MQVKAPPKSLDFFGGSKGAAPKEEEEHASEEEEEDEVEESGVEEPGLLDDAIEEIDAEPGAMSREQV